MPARITRRRLLQAGLLVAGTASIGYFLDEFFGDPLGFTASPRRNAPTDAAASLPWSEAKQIVADTVTPGFPDTTFSVTDLRYGAVGDGVTDDTGAFRRAIQECSSRGGGHVVVPAGSYSTGAIHLLSKVDLHLEAGAVIRFNGNVDGFPLVLTRYEGLECMNHSPMIYAYGQSDIALTGDGTLDASGTRPWNRGLDRAGILEPLVAAGMSPEQRIVPEHGQLRSAFVEPYNCTNVLIQGVTLRQSQFWQVHPTLCRNVTIDRVRTGGTTNVNTDGCNPESCDHVVIKNCTLDAYDDCIAIKSGRDADGRRIDTPSQNIVIHGCTLQGLGGGIALGSELTGGIRNVYAYDVQTFGTRTQYLLYVKSNTRRGGYVENIHLDSIQADHLHNGWAFAEMEYAGQTGSYRPVFRNWSISNASGDSDPWVFQLRGGDNNPIQNVEVRDSTFTHIRIPIDFYSDVSDIRFTNVSINGFHVSQ